MESYLKLGAYYYDSIRPEPPKDAYTFYRSYVSESSGPILEPMCGSGRFLLPLVKEGFNVQGFDASKYMLTLLHNKARPYKLNPCVAQGLLETFASDKNYSLIFIPSGSFGHIIDIPIVEQALANMYRLLGPSGTFLFEVETSHILPKKLGVATTNEKKINPDEVIKVERCLRKNGDIAFSNDKYELYRNGVLVKTEYECIKTRLYDNLDKLISLLMRSGFRRIRALSAFNRSIPAGVMEKSIVIECKK